MAKKTAEKDALGGKKLFEPPGNGRTERINPSEKKRPNTPPPGESWLRVPGKGTHHHKGPGNSPEKNKSGKERREGKLKKGGKPNKICEPPYVGVESKGKSVSERKRKTMRAQKKAFFPNSVGGGCGSRGWFFLWGVFWGEK